MEVIGQQPPAGCSAFRLHSLADYGQDPDQKKANLEPAIETGLTGFRRVGVGCKAGGGGVVVPPNEFVIVCD